MMYFFASLEVYGIEINNGNYELNYGKQLVLNTGWICFFSNMYSG